MAGLDPAIRFRGKMLEVETDGRVKPGHDFHALSKGILVNLFVVRGYHRNRQEF